MTNTLTTPTNGDNFDQLAEAVTAHQPDPDYPTFEHTPHITLPDSVFAARKANLWNHRFQITLAVQHLVAGTPSNPRVAEGWLRRRLQSNDAELAAMIEKTMRDTDTNREDAAEKVITELGGSVNVFRRNHNGHLAIEGRHVKAAIKEAANVAFAAEHFGNQTRWGKTRKGLTPFIAEHVMVPDQYIPICDPTGTPITEPTGVQQRFVHVWHSSAISYEEYVAPAYLTFTLHTDWDFGDKFWEIVWTTGEEQGVGAARSQGYGRYHVVSYQPA